MDDERRLMQLLLEEQTDLCRHYAVLGAQLRDTAREYSAFGEHLKVVSERIAQLEGLMLARTSAQSAAPEAHGMN